MVTVTDRNALEVYNFFARKCELEVLTTSFKNWFSDDLKNQNDIVEHNGEVVISVFHSRENEKIFSTDHPLSLICSIETLKGVLDFYVNVSALLGKSSLGKNISDKFLSQIKTWIVNLSDRLRYKKVLILDSDDQTYAVGGYLTDILRMCSSRYFFEKTLTPFVDAADYLNPDVAIVNTNMSPADFLMRVAKDKLQNTTAFKRGAVFYVAKSTCYFGNINPDNLFVTVSIIFSAVCDLESGYIAPRNSFYKLAYLEMFRHKIG
ncbi:MAG: hypothetical protein NZT61_05495 [Deltaproteobacteria bacterium]|nr:hypothetical protein [Deltaproteobacteria bacterium]